MSLLAALKLPNLSVAALRERAAPLVGGAPPPTPAPKMGTPSAPRDDAAHLAQGVRAQLEARDRELMRNRAAASAASDQLATAIAGAAADRKAELTARKEQIDALIARYDKGPKQVDADRRALDGGAASRDELLRIAARHGKDTAAAGAVQVDRVATGTRTEATTTTSSAADGKARVDTSTAKTSFGAGTATVQTGRRSEISDGESTATRETTKTTTVGVGGASHARSDTQTLTDAHGTQTTSSKTETKIGGGGASTTRTDTRTRADGSGTATTNTGGIERGDGKLGLAAGTDRTKTDGQGNERSAGASGKGGVSSGADGLGGFGDAQGKVGTQRPGGFKTGAVAGLGANVLCNITEVKGSKAPKYLVTLTIDLGVRASLSGGHDKPDDKDKPAGDDAKGSVSVGASASAKVTMKREYVMDEAEVADYVAAVRSGQGSAQELAVLRQGRAKGWDAARDLYLQLFGDGVSAADLARMKSGESRTLTKGGKAGGTIGGGAKGGGFGVSAEGGYERGHEETLKVGKDDDGAIVADANTTESHGVSGKVGVSAGLAEGSFGGGRTWTTSAGLKIRIPKEMTIPAKFLPKPPSKLPADVYAKLQADLKAELQAELAACKSQKDLDAFAQRHPETVDERSATKGVADKQTIGAGVGGVKGTLGYGNSTETTDVVDGKGNFKEQTVVGANEGGLEVDLFGTKIADGEKERAVARRDAQGNASLDVSSTRTSTDTAKVLDNLVGGTKDASRGAVAKATGAKPDTTDTTSSGYSLSTAELTQLGAIACGDWSRWLGAAVKKTMRGDWAKAGTAIVAGKGAPGVVAVEIARFMGKDSVERMIPIAALLRPAGKGGSGARYEFPGKLVELKPRYLALVVDACEATLDAIAKKDDAAKAAEAGDALVKEIETMRRAIEREPGYAEPAARAEMITAANKRIDALQKVLRVLRGGKADEPSKQEVLDAYNRALDTCRNFKHSEKEYFGRVEAYYKDGAKPELRGVIDIAHICKELDGLHAQWRPAYDELAALAQTHDFGKNIYYQYKPDAARLETVRKGGAGKPSAVVAETADKRPPPKPQVSEETTRKMVKDVDNDAVKKVRQFEADLRWARKQAWDLGGKLETLLRKTEIAAPGKLYDQGNTAITSAEGHFKGWKPNDVESMGDHGQAALQRYREAAALFQKGVACYPKDAKQATAKPK